MSAQPLPIQPEPERRMPDVPLQRAEPLEVYRARDRNSIAELALLDVVRRLQRNPRGCCYASQKHLADELGISVRYLRTLTDRLVDRGQLIRSGEVGKKCELRTCGELVISPRAPRNYRSGDPGSVVPTRVGTTDPGKPSKSKPYAPEPAGTPPLFGRKRFFLTQYRPPPGQAGGTYLVYASERLARAFREGWFTHAVHDGRERRVVDVVPRDHLGAFMDLTDDNAPDGTPQRVEVTNQELGSLKLWS